MNKLYYFEVTTSNEKNFSGYCKTKGELDNLCNNLRASEKVLEIALWNTRGDHYSTWKRINAESI